MDAAQHAEDGTATAQPNALTDDPQYIKTQERAHSSANPREDCRGDNVGTRGGTASYFKGVSVGAIRDGKNTEDDYDIEGYCEPTCHGGILKMWPGIAPDGR
jgi:hypothetical protein